MATQDRSTEFINSYEDLTTWQKAMDLVCLIYEETKQLPSTEEYGLIA